MHLFNLAEFGQRFGIDTTVQDFLNAISLASRAATQQVASRFRYETFDAFTDRTELFYVRRMFETEDRGTQARFRLGRGLTSKANITAYYSTTPLHLRNNDTSSLIDLKNYAQDGQSDALYVDGEKGFFFVHGVNLAGLWVLVTYSGGLDVASDDEYQNVPVWLQEAGMAQTALNLSKNRTFTPEDGDQSLDVLKQQLQDLWEEYGRYEPAAYKPVAYE